MAKVVSPVTARVEVIGKPKQSQHGPGTYHPVLFLDEAQNGDAAKIWKNLSGEEVSQLLKGDRVQLVPAGKDKNGNDKHNIVVLSAAPAAPTHAPAPPTATPAPGLTAEQKRAIATFGLEYIKGYAFLYRAAREELEPLGASEETIRAATSTAWISCQRKLGI